MNQKHAYLIMAHNNYDQLGILIELLDDKRNDIFIHIDKKSTLLQKDRVIIKRYAQHSNVYFIPRFSVNWGAYSLIKAELTLLECATRKNEYCYYHLISGADLPLKNQDYIHSFFDANQGKEFINFSDSYYTKKFANRLRYYYFGQEFIKRSDTKLQTICRYYSRFFILIQKLFGVNRIKSFNVASGSNWISITHQFANYLVCNKKRIEHIFKHTVCGDEEIFQTMIINSKFKKNVYSTKPTMYGNQRLIDWKRGNPYTWRKQDFDELVNSDLLFARKFDIVVDNQIINCIRIAVKCRS